MYITDIAIAVIVYLAMFRLEDVGVAAFKKIVNTQHTAKMIKVNI